MPSLLDLNAAPDGEFTAIVAQALVPPWGAQHEVVKGFRVVRGSRVIRRRAYSRCHLLNCSRAGRVGRSGAIGDDLTGTI
jgi:hypothetical protein